MPKAVLGIRPTRIELLKLRRREIIARKGHNLLQEKLDALIIRYQKIQAEVKRSEEELKGQFSASYDALHKAGMITGYTRLKELSWAVPPLSDIPSGITRVAGVKIPTIENIHEPGDAGRGYSYAGTTGQADEAARSFDRLLAALITHAGLTGAAQALDQEITGTRRRVNALEQIIIPSLIDTQRYIEMRLEEREREDLFRRKRTKQLLERKEQ